MASNIWCDIINVMKANLTNWTIIIYLFLTAWLVSAQQINPCVEIRSVQGESAKKIEIDVSTVETLALVAKGYSWGQAVWGEPKLITADDKEQRISDMEPESFAVGWGSFQKNKGPDGKPLKIQDRQFEHGIFAHADSEVVYRLDRKYKRFEAWVGINHTANGQSAANVLFSVQDLGQYRLFAKCQQVLKLVSEQNIASLRKTLERDSKLELLKELSEFEKSAADIRKGLESQSEKALQKAAQFEPFARRCYSDLLDTPLLFVKRHAYMAPHIYDDYLVWHPGGGIYIIENPSAPIEEQKVRAVIDPTTEETLGEGVYRDPDISYDAKFVLFAHKDNNEGNTSIYEIGIDGKGLKRLTEPGCGCENEKLPQGLYGKGQHDVTPCYLPDGRIVFTSTRTRGLVMCFSNYIDILHTMNRDGSDIRCISVNNQTEFDPVVLPDGRIMYGRWEYIDKTALYMQSLWTVNPDGSNETALFANNMAKPTAVLDARPVPNSRLIVASLTPHNGQAVGAIAMINPKIGKNSLDAITNFTPEYPKEMDQGLKQGPSDPWPINENVVLIANNSPAYGKYGVIELIDRDGFRMVIHREPDISCYAPMLIKPRKKESSRPSMIRPDEPGSFLVHDIYQGMDNVERGTVKWIRVIETTSRISGIPGGGRWWNQAFLASWQGSYDIKNFLGIVPVEDDGSAYFEAPTGKALYFQALDKDMRMLQSQRTFVQSVAGVTRSCMGCHIKEDNAAPVNRSIRPLALNKPAEKIRDESWGSGFIDYPSMIQPVLDRNCVSCHGGEKGIKSGIDLTGGWTWAFNISYETLIKNTLTGFLNCNNGAVRTSEILDPNTHGSGVAPLTKVVLSGHKDRLKNMTRKEKELLLVWMDGNCNYYGDWDYSEHAVCKTILDTGSMLAEEMKKANCTSCHDPVIGNDWVNLEKPELSRILRAPLKQGDDGLGIGWCRNRKAVKPRFELVTQRYQPPDVFSPYREPERNSDGEPVVTFDTTDNVFYISMLNIIRQGRETALSAPRVDMPGAQVVKGVCRQLEPVGPPVYINN